MLWDMKLKQRTYRQYFLVSKPQSLKGFFPLYHIHSTAESVWSEHSGK